MPGPHVYKKIRIGLSETQYAILRRLETGKTAFERPSKDVNVIAARARAMRELIFDGYVRDGKLTNEAQEIGKRDAEYTERDDEVIRALYREIPPAAIAERLGRTTHSVHRRAQFLGVRRFRSRAWSKKDDDILRRHYLSLGYKSVASMLGRTPDAVRVRARKIGACAVGMKREIPADHFLKMVGR